MNLDELRSVQSKERQTDSLQHLRESFYADVSAYISELEDERDRAAGQADDPFADPQVRQLTDEIETAREVVEAIYDRRLGKLVKRASLAAADMPADEEGLTAEERELFDDLVERIEHNKTHVLDVLDADEPGAAQPSGAAGTTAEGATPGATDSEAAAGAADSGGSPGAADSEAAAGAAAGETPTAERGREDRATAEAEAVTTPEPTTPPEATDDAAAETAADATPGGDAGGASADRTATPPAGAGEARQRGATSEPSDERAGTAGGTGSGGTGMETRTTVRITGDVDEFYGVDEREYDLDAEDVVALPSDNAEPLLRSGDAERLE